MKGELSIFCNSIINGNCYSLLIKDWHNPDSTQICLVSHDRVELVKWGQELILILQIENKVICGMVNENKKEGMDSSNIGDRAGMALAEV